MKVFLNGEVWQIPDDELTRYLHAVVTHSGHPGVGAPGCTQLLDGVINIDQITEGRALEVLRQLDWVRAKNAVGDLSLPEDLEEGPEPPPL